MPNLVVIRPASVEEMVGAFQFFASQCSDEPTARQHAKPRRPVFIMTSRGELGLPYKANTRVQGQDGVGRGAYVIHDCVDELQPLVSSGQRKREYIVPDIILIGSGQDVSLVMRAKEILLQRSKALNQKLQSSSFPGIHCVAPSLEAVVLKIRVVSMPSWEIFDEQDIAYQDSVLCVGHDVLRLYVEKAATRNTGHDKYAQLSILVPSYGLSGKAADVESHLGFTPEHVAEKVWASWLERYHFPSRIGDEISREEVQDKADVGFVKWLSHVGGLLLSKVQQAFSL